MIYGKVMLDTPIIIETMKKSRQKTRKIGSENPRITGDIGNNMETDNPNYGKILKPN